MFDVLNALYLAATITNQALGIVALSDTDVMVQNGVTVYAVTMKQQAPMWADKCKYDGVMVQYARDWNETQEATGIVLPAEPDRPIGYALILTNEQCPGKEAQAILHTGDKFFYPLFGKEYVIREGHRIDTFAYGNLRDDMRPKWMPQVVKHLESESSRSPAARAFIAEMKRRADTATEKKTPM